MLCHQETSLSRRGRTSSHAKFYYKVQEIIEKKELTINMKKRLRDLEGYSEKLPDITYGGRKLAVQFVLNLEEGGENSVIYGDEHSETFLSEIIAQNPLWKTPHVN